MNNRMIKFLTMGSLVFILAMGSAPATSAQITTNPDVTINPMAQSGAPVFLSISPTASEYGYLKGTEVNISYIALNGDTPWLMGSGNGLDWTTGSAFNTSSAYNATHTLWTVNITVNESGEFKARNADDDAGTNAIWENHPDGPFSNWVLTAIGDPIPDLYDIVGGNYFGDNGDAKKYFAKPGTTVTIIARVINVVNASADFYLVGDLSAIGGLTWDITDRTFAMTYYDFTQVDSNINVTYYSVDITMPDATFEFKIGAYGDWAKSEGGSNNILSNVFLQLSQPTLYDVEGATKEVDRVEGDGAKGAQYRASIGDNIAIWYQIFSLNTCNTTECADTFASKMSSITLELQGDDAGSSLSWTPDDGQLPFTFYQIKLENLTNYANITAEGDGTFNGYTNFTNVQVAYFYINYTVMVETTQFKGYYNDGSAGRWEGAAFSPNNALVAGLVWTSDIVGDVYNVGSFDLSFTGSFAASDANTKDVVGFGIWDGANWMEYNYSGSIPAPAANGSWTFSITINLVDIAGNVLVAGQEGNAQIILYHFDLGLNTQVKQYDPQGSNNFTPKDGVPTGELTGDTNQGADVQLSYTTDGADSTVSSVSIDWADGTTVETLNGTSGDATHTYSADGVYNVTLKIETAAGGMTEVIYTVTVDSTAPTVSMSSPSDGAALTDLVVEFKYSFSDDGSGVKTATLDYGDGSTDNVLGTTSVFHTYSAEGSYSVTLTVVDNAGNEATVTISITISTATTTDEDSSSTSGGLPLEIFPVFAAMIAVGVILRRKR